jgi:hypothetical protein
MSTGKQDGRTRVVIQLWEKWQPIYTGVRGVLAGRLAGHETLL